MKKTASPKTRTSAKKASTAKQKARTGSAKAAPGKPKAKPKAKAGSTGSMTPSQLIDARIAELGDWRGKVLAQIRATIQQADPEVVEEWKWGWTPVWSHDGIICTGETYKHHVKMTFAKGAALADPTGIFNASLDGNVRRGIDLHEGDKLDTKALKALVRAAVALNQAKASGKAKARRRRG